MSVYNLFESSIVLQGYVKVLYLGKQSLINSRLLL